MAIKDVKIETRLTTLEYMLQRLYLITYAANGMTSDQIKVGHENMRQKRRTEQWPSSDPALSAFVAGEIEEAFDNFLLGLESMLENQGLLKK
ncbi:hypothetical protein [Undibacter mobilis]|uniref:Uncharacterized protein n=1 Tax=Undibacter mobilis TaxID=2292256 RepID=A0A371BCR1_9BRAD|nr:hypothetical protein [Undibacter mobilis]RDV05131.1 hypothetical protein DXH78_11490 [Undibacter mobilis]